jgi:hypothetical protein
MQEGCKTSGAFDAMMAEGMGEADAISECSETLPGLYGDLPPEQALLAVLFDSAVYIADLPILDQFSLISPIGIAVARLDEQYPTQAALGSGTYPGVGSLMAYFRSQDVEQTVDGSPGAISLTIDALAAHAARSTGTGLNPYGLMVDERWKSVGNFSRIVGTIAPEPCPEEAECPEPVSSVAGFGN